MSWGSGDRQTVANSSQGFKSPIMHSAWGVTWNLVNVPPIFCKPHTTHLYTLAWVRLHIWVSLGHAINMCYIWLDCWTCTWGTLWWERIPGWKKLLVLYIIDWIKFVSMWLLWHLHIQVLIRHYICSNQPNLHPISTPIWRMIPHKGILCNITVVKRLLLHSFF